MPSYNEKEKDTRTPELPTLVLKAQRPSPLEGLNALSSSENETEGNTPLDVEDDRN